MPGHDKTNTDRLNEIEKGLAAARSVASSNFKPMEGRTYIPRMSPELKQMIIDAIAKKGKRGQRRSRIMGELQNRMASEDNFKKMSEMLSEDLKVEDRNYNYGGKILKKYRR